MPHLNSYQRLSFSIYMPAPPAERGGGTYSKLCPGNEGLISVKFAFVIRVSVTPITLKGKSTWSSQ